MNPDGIPYTMGTDAYTLWVWWDGFKLGLSIGLAMLALACLSLWVKSILTRWLAAD